MADISQVPVIENGAVVGMLDESDVLMSIHTDPRCFTQTVRTAMTQNVETLAPGASIEQAFRILEKGYVVLLMEGEHFLGLITRTDLINHLRQTLK